jgi:4-amino-4-deoxy-L-arabinose transferase-like glycosyltransferase
LIANPASFNSEKSQGGRGPRAAYWALVVVFLAVYVGSMFSPGLFDDADSTHAEAAREMVVTGDYVTLHVNGIRYLEKAPLPYWLVALSYKVLGENEFSTRLPMVLSVMLLGVMGLCWGRRAFGERTGIYTALFVCTCAGAYLFTRVLIPEVLLSLLIAAAMYFFLTALEAGAASWRWYAGYAMMALGVLTKGLIALVFPCGAAFFFLLITGEWRRWREFRLPSGLGLFFAIAAPWHILAGVRNPGTAEHHGFFWFYFVNEHYLRFLGRRYPRDYNKLPAALYWSLHLVWLFPWSLYLPAAVKTAVREWRGQRGGSGQNDFASRTRLLCWLLAGVVLIFFSISTNQEYYTFPAYLPILLLIAEGLSREEEPGSRRWLLWGSGVLVVIGIAVSVVLAAGLWNSRHLPFVADIGTVLAKPNLAAESLSMGHMLDLTGESFAALRLPAILAGVVVLVGPVLAFWLRRSGRHYAATWTTAAWMAIFLIAAHIALVRFGPFLGSKSMAREIARQLRPTDRVMIYTDQAYGSSLLFYLRRPIELVNGRSTSMWFGSTFADAPHIFLDDDQLLQAWNSSQRVFLFVPQHERANVEALLPGPLRVASEVSGKVIFTNHP